MKIKKLKTNQGISMVDVIIAIIILCMFVGVIGNLYYEIALESNMIKYNSIASYYTVKIAENIDRMPYESVTNNLNTTLKEDYSFPDLYNITIDVKNYNEDDTSKKDIIKIVTIRAEYQVFNDERSYQIKKIKIKEK